MLPLWAIILLVLILVLVIVTVARSVVTVRQYERAIVERFGKYRETLDPGIRFIVPFVDAVADRVDMRETVIDVEPQTVITNDNVSVDVDAVIYARAVDPKAVRYEVQNFRLATVRLAQTTLRNVIGEMALDATLTSRERINASMRTTLDEATDSWGVRVTRVEVKEIAPPRDITDAMSKQMKAEREKRATILTAEAYRDQQVLQADGDKQNAVLRAEGEKQRVILAAEGDKQSRILRAEGEAEAIRRVSEAAQQYFVGNAQVLKQLEVTQASLANNTKIVVSDQSRLINVLGLGDRFEPGPGPAKEQK